MKKKKLFVSYIEFEITKLLLLAFQCRLCFWIKSQHLLEQCNIIVCHVEVPPHLSDLSPHTLHCSLYPNHPPPSFSSWNQLGWFPTQDPCTSCFSASAVLSSRQTQKVLLDTQVSTLVSPSQRDLSWLST